MPKPVEIEFLMKDKLSGGIDKAGQAAEVLAKRAKAASDIINSKIVEQQKNIDAVSSKLSRMESQLSGMKPGTAQRELLADVMACRKVLEEERLALAQLEVQHKQAEKAVNDLASQQSKLSDTAGKSAVAQKSLSEKIAESKALIKGTEVDIKNLEKAYKKAASGRTQASALAELNAAKQALEEEKIILSSLTAEQEKNKESGQRLSMQLRMLQDAMAKMRLEGKQNTKEYRNMAQEAANLSDTIQDIRTQTNILSNDDANLQGFISTVSGLSGAFTAATGVISLFASENENLAKIQARVQSVMAITMGLQQLFNTLNKDSAFRLVTVVKMKNMLTAANARLAVALGGSTVAAQALMATLTLGLSAVITALIVAWDKYSDAQEQAATKAKERIEIEAEGRAQMIKSRFEINNAIKDIKNFNGTKTEEKKKVEELNRKFGETFGFYDSLAGWYDVLIQKSSDYIDMLFLQAKAQALVNKAVEADKEVQDIKAKPDDKVAGSHGGTYRFFARMGARLSNGVVSVDDVDRDIDKHNAEVKEAAVKAAEAKRDAYLKEAEDLTAKQAQIGIDKKIGGYVKPENESEEAKLQVQLQEELMALRRKNQREEIELLEEGRKKKIAQIKQNYAEEIAEIEKQESKWRNAQEGNLTREQSDEIAQAKKSSKDKNDKELSAIDEESRRAQEESIREYLKEYGDYQQQKLAIAEEYAEKIAKAEADGNKGEVMRLQRKQQSETAAVEIASVKADIDWQGLFSDLGGLLREQLQPMLDNLKKYIRSDEYKNASVEDKQIVAELIEKLEIETSGGINNKMFSNVAKDITAYKNSLRDLMDAKEEERIAEVNLTKAKDIARKAAETKDTGIMQEAEQIVAEAQETFDEAAKNVEKFSNVNDEASISLKTSSANAISSLMNLSDGLQGLKSGSLTGAAQGLGKIGEATKNLGGVMGDVGNTLAKTFSNGGIIGQIIAAVLSILDVLKEGIGHIVSSLIDSILGAVNGILANILSGKLFTQIGISLFNGVRSILDTVTFGLFSSNGNAKEVNRLVDRLTESNKYLTTAIEKLTDEMNSSGGSKAASYYTNAKEKLEEKISNDQKMLEAKMGYYSAHHSNNYYIGYSQWMGDEVKRLTGQMVNSLSDIWRLSPEDFAKLQESTQLWSKLHEGKYDHSQWIENYVANAGKLEELTTLLYETLNQTDFSGFRDSWFSLLTDLDSTNQDFADNFEEYLQKSILNSLMADKYDDELQRLYDAWAEAGMDGEYSKEEIEKLRAWEQNLTEQMLSTRDKFIDAYGWDNSSTSQSGKSGSFNAMSQEQGTKLEGLFTSGQMHWANIDERVEDVSTKMSIAQDSLRKIEENTSKSATTLDDIKEDVKKIIRDGLKVK